MELKMEKIQIRAQYVISFILLITSLIIAPRVSAEQEIQYIDIVTIDYPPLLGKKGTIMTDISTKAFLAMGIVPKYKTYPMARVVRAIASKTAVAALGSRNWFHQSTIDNMPLFIKLYSLRMRFFYLKSRFPNGLNYHKLPDLAGYKIGYTRGGALIPLFEKENITPQLVSTIRQSLHKTHAGRDDMFAATEIAGWATINEYYEDEVNEFSASENIIQQLSADIIFASDQQYLYETYKKGLNIILQNGTYLRIVKNYYGKREIPKHIIEMINNNLN